MEEELGSEEDFWVDLRVFLALEGAPGRGELWVFVCAYPGLIWVDFGFVLPLLSLCV